MPPKGPVSHPRIETEAVSRQSKPALLIDNDVQRDKKSQPGPDVFTSLFHESWWLDAVTGGNWQEAALTQNGKLIARLPYVMKRTLGMTGIGMPGLTRTLGPQLPLLATPSAAGASEHRVLIRELVEKLPRHDFFNQICDPVMANALGFYMTGYNSALTYTLRLPAGPTLTRTWNNIRKSLRTAIRQAERRFSVHFDLGIEEFIHFHNACVKANHKLIWTKSFENRSDGSKRRIYDACIGRDAICVLSARNEQGQLRAAMILVWGHGVMYYLLNARSPEPESSGAIKLLVWEALKLAHEKKVVFDFDGFSRPEATTILTGYGGTVENRITVTKMPAFLQFAKAVMAQVRLGV